MPPDVPQPKPAPSRDRAVVQHEAPTPPVERREPAHKAVRAFIGASGVELGLLQTGFTQTEIVQILAEIARNEENRPSDRISACAHIQKTVLRAAELEGIIGRASVEERSSGPGGQLVRRVEQHRLIPPRPEDDDSFLAVSEPATPVADRAGANPPGQTGGLAPEGEPGVRGGERPRLGGTPPSGAFGHIHGGVPAEAPPRVEVQR